MLRQKLACYSHQRRCRCINLETTNIAAFALHAAERIDAGVSNFAAGAVDTAPQLAMQNHTAAYAGAQREANDRAQTLSRAAPHLANGGGVRIILDHHRSLQPRLESIC